MCWRQISKLHKTVLTVVLYFSIYILLLLAIAPETTFTFVSDEFRVGDKYALVFLVAPGAEIFSDAEGANVFETRRCSGCFITNNKGFLPMTEYDAVLVFGENLLSQTTAFMDPDKRYFVETSQKCVRNKFRRCSWEPNVISFSNRKNYDMCGFCRHLQEKRLKK